MKTGCKKKNAKKDYIESEVIKICRSQITDEVIANVVKHITSLNAQDQEGLELSRLKKDMRNIEAKIDRLLNQIEDGNSSAKVAERLKQREEELELLKRQYRLEYSKQIHIEPDHARRFLKGLRHGDPNDLEYRKLLVKVFVDKVYLFDDHFRILLNYSGKASQAGNETIQGLEHYFDVECSKSSLCSPPRYFKEIKNDSSDESFFRVLLYHILLLIIIKVSKELFILPIIKRQMVFMGLKHIITGFENVHRHIAAVV